MKETATTMMVLVLLCFAVVSTVLVFADPYAPNSALTPISSGSRGTQQTAQSIGAQGGNVTQVNIDALTVTTSWQGYYGDITGEISLGDAGNNTFYNWSVTTVAGEVYATRTASVTWGTVDCANATQISLEEGYLGQASTDGDSVTNTFNKRSHPALAVGTRNIAANTCNTTNAFSSNNTQSVNWTQVLLNQNVSTVGNVIYTTIINDTTVGFDGATHDFQLLVGENEKTGNIGATTYYFWVELN